MKAYVFPGQGSQKPGMGQNLYNEVLESRALFKKANKILNFNITELMFEGTDEDLLQTKVTQPAIFIHSAILALTSKTFAPDVCAGHSLGEFSALVASNAISFEDGLKLVSIRANAMQKACQDTNGTMAAILGLSDEIIESSCSEIDGVVKPANYNCPGQLVISGEIKSVEKACQLLKEKGHNTDVFDTTFYEFDDDIAYEPGYLAPTPTAEILARVSRNLRNLHLKEDRIEQALRAADRIVLLTPHDWIEVRERGLVHFRLGAYGAAIADFNTYITEVPEAPDRGWVEDLIEAGREHLS